MFAAVIHVVSKITAPVSKKLTGHHSVSQTSVLLMDTYSAYNYPPNTAELATHSKLTKLMDQQPYVIFHQAVFWSLVQHVNTPESQGEIELARTVSQTRNLTSGFQRLLSVISHLIISSDNLIIGPSNVLLPEVFMQLNGLKSILAWTPVQ